ncbi:MAG: acyloxyacyl hydrolase [Thermodesulfobacteriota bacterium]
MGGSCRLNPLSLMMSVAALIWFGQVCGAWEGPNSAFQPGYTGSPAFHVPPDIQGFASPSHGPACGRQPSREDDYLLKMAFGRTFGTCTQLDYATVELTRRIRKFPAVTTLGPAMGEVQLAMLASYVFYHEGTVERIKKLNFEDGFEFGCIPKGRFTFLATDSGFTPYVESGAGIGYVSETFRNSGSRWNWSLLAGFGVEQCLADSSVLSVGLQWRHLSNGNMWGKGDELHNSNSGTDMIQGLATLRRSF